VLPSVERADGMTVPAPALEASQFEAIVSSSRDAIVAKDREGRIIAWSPAAERLYGYAATEAIGRPISILVPSERAGEDREILARALRGERIESYETERVTKWGGRVFVSLTISPIRQPSGEISGASVITHDVSERQRNLERAERLQEVSVRLAREIRPEQTVEVLLEHALPALGADAGAVGILDDRSGTVELAGSRGYTAEGVARFRQMALDARLPMTDVVRTGEALWMSDSDELWRRYAALPSSSSGFSSLAIVPLMAGDQAFGAVSLSFNEPHDFSAEERAFVIATATQAAGAMERSRLFESERRRREQLDFLVEVSEALVSTLDVEVALERLAALAVPRVADWCSVDLADDEAPRNVAIAHAEPAMRSLARDLQRRYPPDPDSPTGAAHVIRSGLPELYPTIPDAFVAAAQDDEHLRLLRELGMVSAIVVPLVARGSTLGALTLASADSDHHYTQDDLAFAEELARHAALVMDNATLYRREHEAALALQRALLPAEVAAPAGVDVAVRYLPAAPGLEVGGDWYDLVTKDRSLAVVVGDVAGRGVQAAAVMGRLRAALRAYVLDGHPPAAAVARLDAVMEDLEQSSMATLVHLALDVSSGRIDYVSAGHPPPLVRDPEGEVSTLEGGGRPPIGIGWQGSAEPGSFTLERGSTLLLYTDGLVERRAAGVGPGLAELRDALASAPDDAEQCADAIVERVAPPELADDAALVVLRLVESPRASRFPRRWIASRSWRGSTSRRPSPAA
jgi:PAS domain S-box-containing protein